MGVLFDMICFLLCWPLSSIGVDDGSNINVCFTCVSGDAEV